jgi:DNA-binding XRE family transcriptional regulator
VNWCPPRGAHSARLLRPESLPARCRCFGFRPTTEGTGAAPIGQVFSALPIQQGCRASHSVCCVSAARGLRSDSISYLDFRTRTPKSSKVLPRTVEWVGKLLVGTGATLGVRRMRNRVRELRERARLTQAEVAKLLDVNESDVSRWESGKRPLSPAAIEKIAAVFKVRSWELFLDRNELRRLTATSDPNASETSDERDGR